MKRPYYNAEEDLANTIILVAVSDYRKALRYQKKTEEIMEDETVDEDRFCRAKTQHDRAMYVIEECEEFFRSELYTRLTRAISGESLIRRIRREICNNVERPTGEVNANVPRLRLGVPDSVRSRRDW